MRLRPLNTYMRTLPRTDSAGQVRRSLLGLILIPFTVCAGGTTTNPLDYINPLTWSIKGIEKIYDWSKEDEEREAICIDTLGRYNCYALALNAKRFELREKNAKPDPYHCMLDSDWITKTGPDGSCPERKNNAE